MANITRAERERRAAEAAAKAAAEAGTAPVEQVEQSAPGEEQESAPVEQTPPADQNAPVGDGIPQDAAECDKLRQIIADLETTIREQSGVIQSLTTQLDAATVAQTQAQTQAASKPVDEKAPWRIVVFNASAIDRLTLSGRTGYSYAFERTNIKGNWCHQASFPNYDKALQVWEDCWDYGRREKRTQPVLLPVTAEQSAEINEQARRAREAQLEAEAEAFREVCAYRAAQGFPPVETYAEHEADMAVRRADAASAALTLGEPFEE